MKNILACVVFVIAAAAFGSTGANAQATRTWVSGVGDDANPCSRTAPCKTFAGAISKTAASGEISVLDPGGFGAVTITKALSIVGQGVEAGVLVSGTNGITINAGPTDNVSIRGLTIEGVGSGLAGIKIIQAGNVYVSDTTIRDFQVSGSGYGVDVESTSNGPKVYLKNLQINNNLIGIYVHGGSVTTGVATDACTITGNTNYSALADTSTSQIQARATSFATTPLALSGGAKLVSNGNNFFAVGSSAPTSVVPLQ